jgi:hypothetical protein
VIKNILRKIKSIFTPFSRITIESYAAKWGG